MIVEFHEGASDDRAHRAQRKVLALIVVYIVLAVAVGAVRSEHQDPGPSATGPAADGKAG